MPKQVKLEKLTVEGMLQQADGSPRGYARGAHLTLRPVLKEDLPALAGLLAEDPYPRRGGPWTLARLEKAFADEKEPGLWKHRERTYVALDPTGRVCGYAREGETDAPGVYRVQHWVAEAMAQRAAAGCELVALHLGLLREWGAAVNVSTRILAARADQAAWLTAAGFVPDALQPGHVWHDGGMQDLQHYVWLCAALDGQPPWSAGEPASSAAVEAIRDW